MKSISLSSLSEETQAAIKRELANSRINLLFDSGEISPEIAESFLKEFPELKTSIFRKRSEGDYMAYRTKLSIPSLESFWLWLGKVPGVRRSEWVVPKEGETTVTVFTD